MPQFKPFFALLPAVSHAFYQEQMRIRPDLPFELPYLEALFAAANPAIPNGSDAQKTALTHGKEALDNLMNNGLYQKSSQASFFVYQAKFQNHVQTGFVGLAAVADYDAAKIMVHENTRADRELQIEAYFAHMGLNTTPVLVSFPANNTLNKLLYKYMQEQPKCNLQVTEQLLVKLWQVNAPIEIHQIQQAFLAIPKLYIADGHHRAKTAQRFGHANPHLQSAQWFPVLAVPASELAVFGFYRRVLTHPSFDFKNILSALEKHFIIKESNLKQMFFQYLPENNFLLVTSNFCWVLKPKKPFELKSNSPSASLDVSLLHSEILSPYFGINDPKTDSRIDFGSSNMRLSAFEELLNAPQTLCVFLTQAPAVDAVFKVADAQEVMPPKSTSFEPKVPSGVVMYQW